MTRPIYLDHHATSPIDPVVVEAMLPYLGPRFGNPHSRTHALGWEAARAVNQARDEVAALVGARPDEIHFTSGATESIRLALEALCESAGAGRVVTLVTATTEHRAVLDCAAALERRGVVVERLDVDELGHIAADDLRQRLTRSRPQAVSLMAANNEIGTIHRLERYAPIAAAAGVLLHSDASQAAGRIPIDVRRVGVDLLSFTAHKIHGPKGAGALFVRRGCPASPLAPGGTPNVPAIVGFGAAARLAREGLAEEAARLAALRDRLLAALTEALDGVVVNGDPRERLPHNLSVSVGGIDGEALLTALPEIAASTGSACESAVGAPSHVLTALGLAPERIRGTIRFGLGRFNDAAQIDAAAALVIDGARRLRTVAGAAAQPRAAEARR